MKNSPAITVILPSVANFRHRGAAKLLRKKLKSSAPTVEELIVRDLSNRRAADIADDFLQSGWKRRADRPCQIQIIREGDTSSVAQKATDSAALNAANL